jgi:hypothetical protein
MPARCVEYTPLTRNGRNRLLACERAGVEPSYVEYEGDDPLGQVNSLNLSRDLTGSQRSLVAARQWLLNGDTNDKGKALRSKRQQLFGTTAGVRDLARQFRASTKSIVHARDLINEAPDLVAQLEACTLSLAAAHEQLETRQLAGS